MIRWSMIISKTNSTHIYEYNPAHSPILCIIFSKSLKKSSDKLSAQFHFSWSKNNRRYMYCIPYVYLPPCPALPPCCSSRSWYVSETHLKNMLQFVDAKHFIHLRVVSKIAASSNVHSKTSGTGCTKAG